MVFLVLACKTPDVPDTSGLEVVVSETGDGELVRYRADQSQSLLALNVLAPEHCDPKKNPANRCLIF